MRGLLALSLVACLAMTGCAAVVVAGAAAGGMALHDRRTLGSQIDDISIGFKTRAKLRDDPDVNKRTHIGVVSFNGILLLTGEAPTVELRDRILSEVRTVPNVRRITNGIRITQPSSVGDRMTDTWITTRVKSDLLKEGLDATRVKVVTDARNVYLMGLVTAAEGAKATEIARMVPNVERVIVLFEYPT